MSRFIFIHLAIFLLMTIGTLLKEFIQSKKGDLKVVSDYEKVFGIKYHVLHKYLEDKRLPGYDILFRLKRAGFNVNKIFTAEVYKNTIAKWKAENNKKDIEGFKNSEYSMVAEPEGKYNPN